MKTKLRITAPTNLFLPISFGVGWHTTSLKMITGVDHFLNDLNGFGTYFGTTPGMKQLAESFKYVRCLGVKISVTFYPQYGESQVAKPPSMGFIIANNDPVSGTSGDQYSTSKLPEQRWARYKILNDPRGGGSPTKVSAYYNISKVMGGVSYDRSEIDYACATKVTSPYVSAPVKKIGYWDYGMFTVDGTSEYAEGIVQSKNMMTLTLYCEYFGRIDIPN